MPFATGNPSCEPSKSFLRMSMSFLRTVGGRLSCCLSAAALSSTSTTVWRERHTPISLACSVMPARLSPLMSISGSSRNFRKESLHVPMLA